jgi:predicted RND superfamily exporter protein
MQKFAEKIVKFRYVILALSILLLIPAAIGFINTKINYDILYYLPDDIETMQGQDVLLNDFGKGAYGIFVCEGMSTTDLQKMAEKVENVDHVAQVLSFDSITEGMIPTEMIPDDVYDILYSEDGTKTIMFIFFDTTSSADETMDAIEEIRSIAGKQCFLSSMAAICLDTKALVENEMFAYTAIAVVLVLLVLFITTDSFLIPVLFLISIGMAIIYNLGTNFIQGEISYITMALVAILQLGVTMDYSIFLYHSYLEASEKYEKPTEAMSHAIAATIVSVAGSSLTTIAGFIAMCFMTFTLGLDMGIVMAKGVVFGVICCVTVLPSLILIFDKQIKKTRHKALTIKGEKLSKLVTKYYPVIAVLMILLWIPAIYGNNNVNVYYKLDESIPDEYASKAANKELGENFDISSISMILVNSDMSSKDVKSMLDEIQGLDGISFALGIDSVTGSLIPDEVLPAEATSSLESENWKLLLVSSEYEVATDEINEQCTEMSKIIKKYDADGMLVGEAPATKDLVEITDTDFTTVSIVSIGAIFILILFVLKSVSLPIILVLVIELAIYVNMAISYYIGSTLPFIASICVGTIQLGATVDYAILMTNRYKKERLSGNGRKDSVRIALQTSVQSIFTSALGFFAATIGVALYSDIDLIGSICMLLARGALLSMAIVFTALPAMLLILDKVIIRTTFDMRPVIKMDAERKRKKKLEAAQTPKAD